MNETKRNEIAEFCESLTQNEAIELCKRVEVLEKKLGINKPEKKDSVNNMK